MAFMEKTIGETRVYTGKIIKVRVDEVQLDDGRVTVREVCEHPGGVAVLPLLPTVPFLLLAALGIRIARSCLRSRRESSRAARRISTAASASFRRRPGIAPGGWIISAACIRRPDI